KAPPNVLSIHRFDSLQSLAAIRSSLQSEDPFLQTVARKQLRLKASSSLFSEWVAEPDSVLQLQTLLAALPVDGIGDSRQLESLLASPYQSVRMATLRFIAHNRRVDLLPALKKVLYQVPIDAEFLDSYLACIRHIQADFIEGYTKQEDRYSRKLVRELPIGFLQNLLKDSKLPVEVRSALVPFIQQDTLDLHIWSALIVASPPNVQQALIKSVEKRSDTFIGDTLLELLRDSNSSDLVKKQILVSLAYQPKNYSKDITDWIGSANFELLPLALKYLARYKQSANEQEEVEKIVNESTDSQLKTLWEFYKGQTAGGQEEKTRAEWLSWTQQAGNPERGKWIFQDPSAQCQLCHQVNGWGGAFGPDLSHVGSSKPQEELLSAILEPSKKMSPEWQGWFVKTLEGKTFTGRQIDVGEKYVELLMANGEFQSFKKPVQFGLLNTSLMPEGLEKRMLPEEFRDLIAYLLSLK
ncbi:MAG: c-type cytochrome, partial [Bacteroidota bacterium]